MKILIPFLLALVLLVCVASSDAEVVVNRALRAIALAPTDTVIDFTGTGVTSCTLYCVDDDFWLRRVFRSSAGRNWDKQRTPIHVAAGPGIYLVMGSVDTLIVRAHTDTVWCLPYE